MGRELVASPTAHSGGSSGPQIPDLNASRKRIWCSLVEIQASRQARATCASLLGICARRAGAMPAGAWEGEIGRGAQENPIDGVVASKRAPLIVIITGVQARCRGGGA